MIATKVLSLFALISISIYSYSQKVHWENDLVHAIEAFNTAEGSEAMQNAALSTRDICDANRTQWQPAIWTSFMYSQIGRLMEDQMSYYDTAQYYLDIVSVESDLDNQVKSEQMVLQSLIYGLKTGTYWANNDRTNAMKYTQLESEALNSALRLNPNNPRIYVLGGASIIRDGKRMKDHIYFLAGEKILKTALEKFEKFPPPSVVYPSWGKSWVPFWLNEAQNNLQ